MRHWEPTDESMNWWLDEDGSNYVIEIDYTQRLMLALMGVTMFLSMWVSNTGSTAMIVPIVEALICELYQVSASIHSTFCLCHQH